MERSKHTRHVINLLTTPFHHARKPSPAGRLPGGLVAKSGPKRHKTLLLVGFLLTALLLAICALRKSLPSRTKLHRIGLQLSGAVLCRSQSTYLCWRMRGVLDDAFRGDLAVMAQQLAAGPQPREPWLAAPLPEGGAALSRGIVVAAGGTVYVGNAFVNLYVLRRHLSCTLPVAIMYWGSSPKDAISNATKAFVQEHLPDVEFIDASALPYPPHQRWLMAPEVAQDDDRFNGWKVKVFALYAAPFDEVLVLDGDSTPLADPAPLFDHPSYRRHGNLFFPDAGCAPLPLFRLLPGEDLWAGGARRWQAESGQLVFNRRAHADVLEWVLFLNARDEVTYHWAHGDKDTFRAGFSLAGKPEEYNQVEQPLSIPLYTPSRKGGKMRIRGLLQHGPEGEMLFLHRAGGGRGPRKYDCRAPERFRPVSHLLLQPSCPYLESVDLEGPALSFQPGQILTRQRCAGAPGAGPYNLSTSGAARRACGLPPVRAGGLEASPAEPAVFEVGGTQQLGRVQRWADAAFRLLLQQQQLDPTVC